MDFGVAMGSAAPENEKGQGSVNLKHLRSGIYEDSWRPPKMHKPGEIDFTFKESESFSGFGRSNFWPSAAEDGQKMLSFSSSDQQCGVGLALSFCQDELQSKTRGVRFRGSFTPSQWMELEHQALIYKHFVSHVPVPPNLLVPISRSLYSNGPSRSYNSDFLGWGTLHLGFSGTNDPELGRCRRTDGKKWRCSRDAVPDQKYCEKHINRGLHRSRKPVEGQTGHAVSGSTGAKVATPLGSSSSAVVMSSVSASSNLDAMKTRFTSSTDHLVGRSQGIQGLSLIPPAEGFKSKDAHMLFDETPQLEFGIVYSDSFLNSSERISYSNSDSDPFLRFNDKNTIHHFVDNWPKDRPAEELKSDWTQLSMSIPMAPDFSSSSTSPAGKSPISSLRLYQEVDPIQMSLGVSHDKGPCTDKEKQPSWLPVSWGNSMGGGPLGEVLISTAAAAEAGKSSSSQKGLKSSSQTGSSPTGVLQKTTFVSLSNCSSPICNENEKPPEKSILFSNLLSSTFFRSAATIRSEFAMPTEE